jgi:hypothetical protein
VDRLAAGSKEVARLRFRYRHETYSVTSDADKTLVLIAADAAARAPKGIGKL